MAQALTLSSGGGPPACSYTGTGMFMGDYFRLLFQETTEILQKCRVKTSLCQTPWGGCPGLGLQQLQGTALISQERSELCQGFCNQTQQLSAALGAGARPG